MASVEDFLDEVLLSDNDSESGQLHESSGPPRTTDMEENLEAQIALCLEVFDKLDLLPNALLKNTEVMSQIKLIKNF